MKPKCRLCWSCNRQFYGRHHKIVLVNGNPVAVHVQCAERMIADGVAVEQ